MQVRAALFTALSLSAALATSGAFADVVISSDATQNMNCSGGVCTPTATDAVLNVGDLENLLAAGNVAVSTSGSGVQASNMDVAAAFDWSSASGLTLDAYQSTTFTAPVTDSGAGSISLVTNDGGSNGALSFLPAGNLSFADAKAAGLSVNGRKYKLEQTLKLLVNDIVAKPNGAFALADSFDARRERAYSASPISIPFGGSFIGLGNTISRFEIEDESNTSVGLFANVTATGVVSGVRLENVVVRAGATGSAAGALVGTNSGIVTNSASSGSVQGFYVGGLVGLNEGTVFRSSSIASVKSDSFLGGLVGENHQTAIIDESFAAGRVKGGYDGNDSFDGGLAGANFGQITNSYATGNIKDASGPVGGLLGFINESFGSVSTSYATGVPRGESAGGFLGEDYLDAETISNCYWDTTTSRTRLGVGSGNEAGVTGLTTRQLQSGLPAGFDPTIWGENANINNGLPYLLANPPAN